VSELDQLPFLARLKAFYYSMIGLFFGVGMLQAIESMGKLTGVLRHYGNSHFIHSDSASAVLLLLFGANAYQSVHPL